AVPTANQPAPTGGRTAEFKVVISRSGGDQADVTVANAGTEPITGWAVSWTGSGTINQIWGGKHTASGSSVTVRNESWNGALAPAGTTTFGFLANGTGTVHDPVTCPPERSS